MEINTSKLREQLSNVSSVGSTIKSVKSIVSFVYSGLSNEVSNRIGKSKLRTVKDNLEYAELKSSSLYDYVSFAACKYEETENKNIIQANSNTIDNNANYNEDLLQRILRVPVISSLFVPFANLLIYPQLLKKFENEYQRETLFRNIIEKIKLILNKFSVSGDKKTYKFISKFSFSDEEIVQLSMSTIRSKEQLEIMSKANEELYNWKHELDSRDYLNDMYSLVNPKDTFEYMNEINFFDKAAITYDAGILGVAGMLTGKYEREMIEKSIKMMLSNYSREDISGISINDANKIAEYLKGVDEINEILDWNNVLISLDIDVKHVDSISKLSKQLGNIGDNIDLAIFGSEQISILIQTYDKNYYSLVSLRDILEKTHPDQEDIIFEAMDNIIKEYDKKVLSVMTNTGEKILDEGVDSIISYATGGLFGPVMLGINVVFDISGNSKKGERIIDLSALFNTSASLYDSIDVLYKKIQDGKHTQKDLNDLEIIYNMLKANRMAQLELLIEKEKNGSDLQKEYFEEMAKIKALNIDKFLDSAKSTIGAYENSKDIVLTQDGYYLKKTDCFLIGDKYYGEILYDSGVMPTNLDIPIKGNYKKSLPRYSSIVDMDGKFIRTASVYNEIINQFEVDDSIRYQKKGGSTYCNIYMADVLVACGVEEFKNYQGTGQMLKADGSKQYLNANGLYDLFNENSGYKDYGFVEVDAETAQAYANSGIPTIGLSKNLTGGSGHCVVVRPETEDYQFSGSMPVVSQAGSDPRSYDSYGNNYISNNYSTKYYVHSKNENL